MLALKAIGAVLVCLCGFFTGYKKAQKLDMRAKALALMLSFLREIQAGIRYKRENITELLSYTVKQEKYLPLKLSFSCTSAPDWPLNREAALSFAKKTLITYMPLTEIELFFDALRALGESNARQEDEQLEYCCVKLNELCKNALETAAKNKKLYTGVGLFAGAAIAIILL